MHTQADTVLYRFLREIQGPAESSRTAIAVQLGTGSGGISKWRISMLQMINRYEPLFEHLATLKNCCIQFLLAHPVPGR
ncbi:MAG: hypothetical protein R3E89_17040 [Thiolinea sp.]